MNIPSAPKNLFTPYLATTWNLPEENDRLGVFLLDTFSIMADIINAKKIGLYVQETEIQNGNKIFYDKPSISRDGFEYLVRIKNYPAAGSIIIPIPIVNPEFVVVDVWGSASKPPTTPGTGDYFSYYSEGNSKITFIMSDTAITLKVTADMSLYTGFIIIEYIKNGF